MSDRKIINNSKKEEIRDMAKIFTKDVLKKYAKVMVWGLEEARKTGGGEYVPGDNIILRYQPAARLLAEHIYSILLKRGFNVVLEPGAHYRMEKLLFTEAVRDQLEFVPAWKKSLYRNAHGLISLFAPESLTHLQNCDPGKMAMNSLTMKKLRDILTKREFTGEFGWTLSMMPTRALAKQAKMSVEDYGRQIVRACYLDEEDPVEKWIDTYSKIDRVKAWLTDMKIEYVHVQSEDGETDLRVWIGPESGWLGGSGHNVPSFEVFISPEAGRAEGIFHANESSFKKGRYVRDVRLEFKNGRVIKTTAAKEEKFVKSRVNLDKGSGMIGEFSLTDRRFSRINCFMAHTLFDENVGGEDGNSHIAIGRAFPECYTGKEKMTPALARKLKFNESAEHWDLVTTTPRIVKAYPRGGGEVVIYKAGEFTLDF